VEISGIEPLTS